MHLDEMNQANLGGWYLRVSTKGDCLASVEVYALLSAIIVSSLQFAVLTTAVKEIPLNEKGSRLKKV